MGFSAIFHLNPCPTFRGYIAIVPSMWYSEMAKNKLYYRTYEELTPLSRSVTVISSGFLPLNISITVPMRN